MKPGAMSEVSHLRITLCGAYDIVSNLVGITNIWPNFSSQLYPKLCIRFVNFVHLCRFVGQSLFRVICIHPSQFLWAITSTSCHGHGCFTNYLTLHEGDPISMWWTTKKKIELFLWPLLGFLTYIEEIDAFPSAKFNMHEQHQCSCLTTIGS